MAWSLAPSLAAARDEANRIAPKRSRISDGTIGDLAHAARQSDHNPGPRDRVHALDLTHDPVNGFDVHARLEQLRIAQDRRVKYLISNDRICGPGSGGGGWIWRPYQPFNPSRNKHIKHGHISIHSTIAAETDTRPWWPAASISRPHIPPLHHYIEDDDMPLNAKTTVDKLDCPHGDGWYELEADGGVRTEGGCSHFYGSYFSLSDTDRNNPQRRFVAISRRRDRQPGYTIYANDGTEGYTFGPDA